MIDDDRWVVADEKTGTTSEGDSTDRPGFLKYMQNPKI